MNVDIHPSWQKVLQEYFDTDAFKRLTDFIREEYQSKTVYPHPRNLFQAFNTTPFDQVRVVILGQDPYHNPRQAHGLSFSVPDGMTLPPSLKNIYKEIQSDCGTDLSNRNGDLSHWATQGVFLLNAVLSVLENNPTSHAGKGWEEFTDFVIKKLSDEHTGLVFMLWGSYAQKKGINIDWTKHLVLEAPHPSPLSAYRGFLGCKHFSKANAYLEKQRKMKIDW